MKTIITELIPTSSRKSFYGKAKIIEANGAKYLKSYDTIVASIKDGKTYRHTGFKSNTTGNHIRSFLQTVGSEIVTTKEFYALPLSERDPIEVTL